MNDITPKDSPSAPSVNPSQSPKSTQSLTVLDKGFVTLKDVMGNDLTIVQAARVSFHKESTWEHKAGSVNSSNNGLYFRNVLSEKDSKLIRYLAANGHWTPFGHPQLTLHFKMPIFVARQFMRSTVGIVYNEISRRYIDETPEFYIPETWRGRPTKSMKQGSSDEEIYVGIDTRNAAWKHALSIYEALLYDGVAPEMARIVLPLSTYTEFWATFSLAAITRVCKLRSDSHAQKEIRDYVEAISKLVEPLFPVSWPCLLNHQV